MKILFIFGIAELMSVKNLRKFSEDCSYSELMQVPFFLSNCTQFAKCKNPLSTIIESNINILSSRTQSRKLIDFANLKSQTWFYFVIRWTIQTKEAKHVHCIIWQLCSFSFFDVNNYDLINIRIMISQAIFKQNVELT